MPDIIDFPSNLYTPNAVEIAPVFQSRSGGRTLTGREDIIGSDAGYWSMRLSFPVRKEADRRLWRAIRHKLGGRKNWLRIGVFDCRGRPLNLVPGARDLLDAVPHSDDTFFSDGTGYVGYAIEATLDAALPVRSTVAVVNVSEEWPIEPGHYFSINGRLYVIEALTWNYGDSPGTTQATITLWPPTREAYLAGANLNFDSPTGLFRMESDGSGAMPLNPGNMTFVTLDLVEP